MCKIKEKEDIRLYQKKLWITYSRNIINNIGTSRETKDNTSKEIIIDENEIFSQGSKENLIPNPQTPFLNNNDNILSDVNSEGWYKWKYYWTYDILFSFSINNINIIIN